MRKSGHTQYINQLKEETKNRHRHSYFWTGLCGATWVLSMDICWLWVEKLMKTAINKLPFYLQGVHQIVNLSDERRHILQFFTESCHRYYLIPAPDY